MRKNKELLEVTLLFLKLGFTAFGGPAAHIAMMEREVVVKRKWLTQDHFLDLIGATSLIPGPNSTEMTMHLGYERAGWKGLIVAGICFILPAVIITTGLALAYQQYGNLPTVQPFIYGIKPSIIAVIISLMFSLGRKAAKSSQLLIMGIISALLALLGANEIYLLFGFGILGVFLASFKKKKYPLQSFLPLFLFLANASNDLSKWNVFLIFLKVGAILYGSGYVLFAFLDAELVSKGLLSRQVLTDAIAVGQFTPGPVFSSATFIGWQLAGLSGAVTATLGIFLPSFLFVAFLNPVMVRLRKSAMMSAFLDAVNIVSVALILTVCVEMTKESIKDWRTIVIAALGFLISFKFPKLNTAYVILGGSIVGYLLYQTL